MALASAWLANFGDPEAWRKLVVWFFEHDDRSVDHAKLIGWASFGVCVGIYWFFKGFWVYRKYRVIEDTPETPIRSMAMGLVEVHGKAVGEPTVVSPVSHTPCLFYQVKIDKWHSDQKGRGGTYRPYKTGSGGIPFHLEDPTGKVLIDAKGADFDLNEVEQREVDGFIAGSFMPTAYEDDPVVDPSVSSSFDASDHEVLMFITKTAGKSGLISGRYRVTEYCIQPEEWYDVTGTCCENPQAADEHDRNLIVKGQNEPTFMISVHNKQDLESELRWKAMRGVFGGGVLAVLSLWFLLMQVGWL